MLKPNNLLYSKIINKKEKGLNSKLRYVNSIGLLDFPLEEHTKYKEI